MNRSPFQRCALRVALLALLAGLPATAQTSDDDLQALVDGRSLNWEGRELPLPPGAITVRLNDTRSARIP